MHKEVVSERWNINLTKVAVVADSEIQKFVPVILPPKRFSGGPCIGTRISLPRNQLRTECAKPKPGSPPPPPKKSHSQME